MFEICQFCIFKIRKGFGGFQGALRGVSGVFQRGFKGVPARLRKDFRGVSYRGVKGALVIFERRFRELSSELQRGCEAL